MTGNQRKSEKWAMIPESIITGGLPSCQSTTARAMCLMLFCYLDLRQGARGWPVRGFRQVARKLGVQERTVSVAAKSLAQDGLIELILTKPTSSSAVMRVVHNPARGHFNSNVGIDETPWRYRHGSVPYTGETNVQEAHPAVQGTHDSQGHPDASHATGSSSPRYEWLSDETMTSLQPILAVAKRCQTCLLLISRPSWEASPEEFCQCPFINEKEAGDLRS